MSFVRKGIFVLLGLATAVLVLPLGTGRELGSRPASSLADHSPRPDVQFVTANEIRSGYLEMGEGP